MNVENSGSRYQQYLGNVQRRGTVGQNVFKMYCPYLTSTSTYIFEVSTPFYDFLAITLHWLEGFLRVCGFWCLPIGTSIKLYEKQKKYEF